MQRRKDPEAIPYINHPIAVATLIATVGGITDIAIIMAGILHDTVEDTDTSPAELEAHFGAVVRQIVEELTDDKALPKDVRKSLQIKHAPSASVGAKIVKLADKICNLIDISDTPPPDWGAERIAAYLSWSEAVVAGCRGANPGLEQRFDLVLSRARSVCG